MVRTTALAVGAAIALLASSSVFAQDEAQRFKLIDRLQTAGATAAMLGICEDAGYVPRDDAVMSQFNGAVSFATDAGMAEETASDYVTAGMHGRNGEIEASMRRIQRLIKDDDPTWRTAAEAYVKDIAGRCDLLAKGRSTAGLFSYSPLSAAAAAHVMRDRMGLNPR